MKKALLIIFILFGWIYANAQNFTPSDSYLYGVGISPDEESADSVAMLSLSRSIYTKVTNESKRTVSEENGSYSSSFTKTTGLNSSLGISGAKKDVSINGDGQYVVYRYINKGEYIKDRLRRYAEHMKAGEELSKKQYMDSTKHKLNLALGHFYRAYEAVSDTTGLFSLLYGFDNAKSLSSVSLKRIEETYYCQWEDVCANPSDGLDNSNGFREVYAYSGMFSAKYLYAFEYFDGAKWSKPVQFYNDRNSFCTTYDDSIGDESFSKAVVKFIPKFDERGKICILEYRWLFEEKIDGIYCKINVPEWLYYLKPNRENYINIRI